MLCLFNSNRFQMLITLASIKQMPQIMYVSDNH